MASEEKPPSIWKKEMSFRRKPAEERAPDAPSEAAAETEVATAEPEHQPEPEVALAPVSAAAPKPALEPAPTVEHSWLTKPLEQVSEPPEEPLAAVPAEAMPAEAVPAVEAAPSVEPAAEAPTLVPSPVSLVPAEPVAIEEGGESLLKPELVVDPDLHVVAHAAPAPAEVSALPAIVLPDLPQPPAPVSDPAPAAEAETKVPFYKKELSLKRSPRERRPKPEKTPRSARTRRERPAKADAGDKVPFYKRELSLKRGPKEWDAAEPASEPKPKARRPARPRPSLPSLSSLSRGNAKKIVGLKIGGSQIAAACVSNGASPELVQAVREPLEHGVVVGGELRDPEALAVALRAFFKRHKLPRRGVRLGIANNRIGVRTFEVTGIDDSKQLANAIRFRAQEVLPIPLEEAVLDYQVLSHSVNEEGQKVSRVLLVVAYRELVDRYVYACKKAGLQIVGIDLEAFALLRAIAEPQDPVPGSERGALVAVSVGHDRSTFAVSDRRTCEFTRVLEWGGWALNVAIARALDTSPSEAEPIKRALSFAGPTEVPEGYNEEQFSTAREAARRQLQTFARELVSSLQFYQNQPGSLGIGEIVLTGGTAHLPGLGAELERLIGVPVRVADPLTRLKVSKKAAEQPQLGSLAVAIGLGIDD